MSENENGVCFGPNFKTFISVTAGTFFGVFFALNLFSVVHLPYLDKMQPGKPHVQNVQMQRILHTQEPVMEEQNNETAPEYKQAE